MAKAKTQDQVLKINEPINTDFPNIPEFLLVKNQNKKIPIPKMANIPKRAESKISDEDAALQALPPDIRRQIEAAIAAGKFQRHWVKDYNSVRQFMAQNDEKQMKRANVLHKLASLPKPERKPKIIFGVGVKVQVIQAAPRGEGTGAAKRYADMVEWVKKNPSGDVAGLLAAGIYGRNDFNWDVTRGNIKTDIAIITPRATTAPRAPKAPAALPKPTLPLASKDVVWSGSAKKTEKPAPKPVTRKTDLSKVGKKALRSFKKNGGKVKKISKK